LVGSPEGKISLGRHMDDNIAVDIIATGWKKWGGIYVA
jgi:hypothetical protein